MIKTHFTYISFRILFNTWFPSLGGQPFFPHTCTFTRSLKNVVFPLLFIPLSDVIHDVFESNNALRFTYFRQETKDERDLSLLIPNWMQWT